MAINIKGMNRAQLDDVISRATKRRDELSGVELQAARKQVQSIAKAGGFDLNDLIGNSPRTGGNQTNASGAQTRAAKYRNPADHSQVWSGRGKRPKWFNASLSAGKTQQDMLVH